MEQNSSGYQSLKILLAEYVPIDRDILQVVIGLALTLVAIAITGRSLRLRPFVGAFVVACLLGSAMEVLDMRDDMNSLGLWRWQASILDFLRTVFVPIIGLSVVWLLRRKRTL